MATDRTEFSKEVENLSPAIADLVEGLDSRELERLTVLSMQEHHKRLQAAQDAYDEWRAADVADREDADERKSQYLKATLDNRVQMAIVAVLVERLGRVPELPDDGELPARSVDGPLQS